MRKSQIAVRIVSMVCAALPWSAVAHAQAIDPAFTPPGTIVVGEMAVQPDGKVLVSVIRPGDLTTGTLVRLSADGSIDASFASPIYNHYVSDLAVQPDGKVIIGGSFSTFYDDAGGTTPRDHIARLNADGSLDMTFNPGANNTVLQLSPQPDGKILVGGQFSVLAGRRGTTRGASTRTARLTQASTLSSSAEVSSMNWSSNRMARFSSQGTSVRWRRLAQPHRTSECRWLAGYRFDPRMSGGSVYIYTMAVQPDGKILLGGDFTGFSPPGYDFTTRNRLVRLNADGSVDTSFDPGSNSSVSTLAVQPDGRSSSAVTSRRSAVLPRARKHATASAVSTRTARSTPPSILARMPPSADSSAVRRPDPRRGQLHDARRRGTGTTARNQIGRLVSALLCRSVGDNASFRSYLDGRTGRRRSPPPRPAPPRRRFSGSRDTLAAPGARSPARPRPPTNTSSFSVRGRGTSFARFSRTWRIRSRPTPPR